MGAFSLAAALLTPPPPPKPQASLRLNSTGEFSQQSGIGFRKLADLDSGWEN